MSAKDVMHKGTTCAESGTPVKEIAKRVRDSGVGAIPVNADGRLVGIIADRDITCRTQRQPDDNDRQGHHDEGCAIRATVLSEDAAGVEAPHCCVLEREAD